MIDKMKIKELREKTGSKLQDCANALASCDNDVGKAITWLRICNALGVVDKGARAATEGIIKVYQHANGKIGVMIEINCETDFATKSDVFQSFAKDMSLQIAAMNPTYISKNSVAEYEIMRESDILRDKAIYENKPQKLLDRIVEGGIKKWLTDNCLLEQPFVKENSKTCGDLLNEVSTKLGEKIVIRRFERWELNG